MPQTLQPQQPDPRWRTELVPWEYVSRSGRKGYLTLDFFIGDRRYEWFSNRVCKDGLLRTGRLVPGQVDHQATFHQPRF